MKDEHNEKVLQDFKLVLKHQIILLREATGANTAYFYWVNRRRKQFVLESRSTRHTNVMFQDRVSFDQHFLDQYRDITSMHRLEVGEKHQIDPTELTHYYNDVPVSHLTLIPLIQNGETIALTMLEFESDQEAARRNSVIESYMESLDNLTGTYMKINQLNRSEEQWERYEKEIMKLLEETGRKEPVSMLIELAKTLNQHLSQGGVALLASEGETWLTLISVQSGRDVQPVVPGLEVEKGSIAADSLAEGQPLYISHLNGSPKRISSREPEHHGATLAVPVYINHEIQCLILIYDENPLVFRDSVKHKLINLVRVVAQQISIHLGDQDASNPFRDSETGLFRLSAWRTLLEHLAEEAVAGERSLSVGTVKVQNLQEVRTRLRLEQLKQVERKFLARIRPSDMGLPGLVGLLEDYTYVVILPDHREETRDYYKNTLKQRMESPLEMDEGNDDVKFDVSATFSQLDALEDADMERFVRLLRQNGD